MCCECGGGNKGNSTNGTTPNVTPDATPDATPNVTPDENTQEANYCHYAHQRLKDSKDIFYEVNSGQYEYLDDKFSKDKMIRDPAHL